MWKVYFNLNKLAQLEANTEINGVKAQVSRGSDQLVAEFVEACDETDAHQKALTVANRFLDVLSWKFGAIFAIDPSTQRMEHISPTGQKRISITASCVAGASIASRVVKKDSSGNIVEVYDSSKPGKIDVKPSEAASHFRHAHLAKDPFNKFRDLYLAAENVASKIQVAKKLSKNELKQLSESGESYEEGLLKLALDECFGNETQPLKQSAKNLPDFDDAHEVIPQVAKILFKGYRCQLNHSKASQDKKIPFNPEDEKKVKAVLPLMEFVAKSLLQYEENSLVIAEKIEKEKEG